MLFKRVKCYHKSIRNGGTKLPLHQNYKLFYLLRFLNESKWKTKDLPWISCCQKMFGYFGFQIYKQFQENAHKHSYAFLETFFQKKFIVTITLISSRYKKAIFCFVGNHPVSISHRHGKKAIHYLINTWNWLINNINGLAQLSDWIFIRFFYQIKTVETLLNACWKFPLDSVFPLGIFSIK